MRSFIGFRAWGELAAGLRLSRREVGAAPLLAIGTGEALALRRRRRRG